MAKRRPSADQAQPRGEKSGLPKDSRTRELHWRWKNSGPPCPRPAACCHTIARGPKVPTAMRGGKMDVKLTPVKCAFGCHSSCSSFTPSAFTSYSLTLPSLALAANLTGEPQATPVTEPPKVPREWFETSSSGSSEAMKPGESRSWKGERSHSRTWSSSPPLATNPPAAGEKATALMPSSCSAPTASRRGVRRSGPRFHT
mmetsp:Transcript_1813/g.5278  ORF Transcript_1813/g.5278 Transcript_1813/m.5278 type:complete len:200 (+) Transcript_1813:907-1506(+)